MRGTDTLSLRPGQTSEQVAEVVNAAAGGRLVLASEHASNCIPAKFDGLGLDADARQSHIAWDPGAEPLARAMSDILAAPLVLSCVSRLVYDCNRALSHPGATAETSELYAIPGNADLSDAEREARKRDYYDPFRALLAQTLRRAGPDAVLVTVHTFIPVYFHTPRAVEIGLLHDADSRLADRMLASAADHSNHLVRRNEPYSPKDGVTHTLKEHAIPNGLANVMVEVRNDLVASAEARDCMAHMLCAWLGEAITALNTDAEIA